MQPDLIVMRTNYSGGVKFFAKNVRAAVLNAGDGWNEHPTQALLDFYTMKKKLGKDLKGKKIVIVGDVYHSRVFGSMVRLAQREGMEIVVTAPETLIRPDMEQWGVTYVPHIEDALPGADIVYALRLQTERAAAAFVPTLREYSKTYVVNADRMKLAPNAIVMHAGPVIREFDVHTNVLEDDISVLPEQVFAGYCVRSMVIWLMSDKRKLKTVDKRLY
jgi:aspartate carbamoyltransferase catalytic subunit